MNQKWMCFRIVSLVLAAPSDINTKGMSMLYTPQKLSFNSNVGEQPGQAMEVKWSLENWMLCAAKVDAPCL